MTIPNTWQWRPNWAAGVTERLEWRTDVQQAYDGTESRFALRAVPRRTWSWEMTLTDPERQRFEAAFWANASGTWLVPLWWDVSVSSFAVGASQWSRLTLPDDRELPEGQYLVISDAAGAQGFGPYTITSITIGGLPGLRYSWIGAVARAYPNAKVHPGRLASVVLDGVSNVTAGVATYRFTAEAIADTSPGELPGAAALGTTAFLERPDRIEPIDQTWEMLRDRVDYGGPWQYDTRRASPVPAHQHNIVASTRARTYSIRRKLHYQKGRHRRIALPTYEQDLTPLGGAVAGTNALDVRVVNWTGLYSTRPGRSNIVIADRSGAYHFASIAAASIAGDVETLALSSPWPVDVPLASIRAVSWAELARLDSDAIEFVWRTPEVCEIALPWRAVP